jgi:anti-sigma-K factor RskA
LQGLADLDDTVRLAIFLAFYKGYDYPRIAHRIERSVSQARQMVTQGLQTLLDTNDAEQQQAVTLAEYTLGLLNSDEVKSVHALLAHDDVAVLEALSWEDRFLGLTDLLTVVPPSGQVYYRIQARLGHDAIPSSGTLLRQPEQQAPVDVPAEPAQALEPPPRPELDDLVPDNAVVSMRTTQAEGLLHHGVESEGPVQDAGLLHHATDPQQRYQPTPAQATGGRLWKWLAIFFALVAAGALASHAFRPPPEPPVTVIKIAPQMGAILQPPSASSTPGWVVSMDHNQSLLFRPLVHTEIPGDAQLMLWTRATTTEPSRLLATPDPNQPFTLTASQTGLIKDGQILEMTQEPLQVDASAGPQGPVLFIGRMVVFGPQATPANGGGQAGTN